MPFRRSGSSRTQRSRIRFHHERLRVGLSVYRESGAEVSDVAPVERTSLIGWRRSARTLPKRIPGYAVHSSAGRWQLRLTLPQRRYPRKAGRLRRPSGGGRWTLRLWIARQRLQHRPARVDDLDHDRRARRLLQVVVDHYSARRILSVGLILLKRRTVVTPLYEVDRIGGLEEPGVARDHCIADLPKGRDIVDHPEATSVGRDYQVVAVDHQVAHRRYRHVELERLPVVAVIEGDVHTTLCTGDQ